MEPSGVGHSELTKDLSVNSFVHAEIYFTTLGHFINQAKLHPLGGGQKEGLRGESRFGC